MPPVGLEPTLVTLLGGLPLPLGYEGTTIVPVPHKRLVQGLLGHVEPDSARPTQPDRVSSRSGRAASSKACRGSVNSGSDVKSLGNSAPNIQLASTRNLRLIVGTA